MVLQTKRMLAAHSLKEPRTIGIFELSQQIGHTSTTLENQQTVCDSIRIPNWTGSHHYYF